MAPQSALAKIGATLAAVMCLLCQPARADTLVYNIEGITLERDGEVTRFTNLVFDENGTITRIIGRGEERPQDIEFAIDGQGRVMLPGFIDAHLHVMGIGIGALTLDLSDTASLDEALARIAQFAASNPGRPWILGRGWNQEKWGLGRFPTAAELDAVVPDRPVWLSRVDGHAGWANSIAMERAGVAAATLDPEGGIVVRIPGSREPSGVFVDAAETLVQRVVPQPRAEDRDLALRKAQDLLVARGITAVADMGTSIADWHTMRRAGDQGALKLRVMAYADSLSTLEIVAGSGPTPWLYDDRLRMGGIKIYLDGALGSRGAALKAPYADQSGHLGLMMLKPAQLRNTMSAAAMDGFQTAVHAIGDAANAEVLTAIAELSESYQGDRRWRIEHAQIVDPADIQSFGQHGVIASMQPLHQTSDRTMAEARLGAQRLAGAYAWRSVLSAGGTLAFGSDAPVEPPDVFAGLAAAISRTDATGEPFGGWYPHETVSREQALAAFTVSAAYAGFAEGRFGRLIPGERADFVLIDRDPLLASAEEMRSIRVLETWIGGERVFSSEAGGR